MIMRMVVVLPAPLGPMKPQSEPRGTSRSSSDTAVVAPKVLVTPRRRMAESKPSLLWHRNPTQMLRIRTDYCMNRMPRILFDRSGPPFTFCANLEGPSLSFF